MIFEAHDDGVDAIWLRLWEPTVRFKIGREPEARRQALAFLIHRANDGAREVTIRYDAAHGRLNRETGTLDYPLCSIAVEDLQVDSGAPCGSASVESPATPEGALLLAQAQESTGRYRDALKLLDRPGMPTDPAFRKLFLRVHAQAQQGLVETEPAASPAADRASIAQLADYRELAKLEPDNVEHRFSIATVLADLGAYPESAAALDEIIAKWPDEHYRIAVRRGALHRMQGHYETALQALNALVAAEGPQPGMKFHYHRAWTLSLLGRFDEAIADLDQGLKEQPDYASAYLRRACAHASLGQIRQALDDVGEASRLYAALPEAVAAEVVQDEIRELASMRQRLEAALARGETKPVAGTCAGPSWTSQERPRPRSALLPRD